MFSSRSSPFRVRPRAWPGVWPFRALPPGAWPSLALPSRLLAASLLVPFWLLPGSSPPATWLWPVPAPHSVTRSFEAAASPYAAGHRGIDLPERRGAPVFAPAGGVVSFSGVVAGRPVVSISHPGDLVSTVEPVLGVVPVGDRVAAGQRIGLVASGGHCADACLHFGVRLHGQYVSPMLFLGGVPRAVLLPLRASPLRETAVVPLKTPS